MLGTVAVCAIQSGCTVYNTLFMAHFIYVLSTTTIILNIIFPNVIPDTFSEYFWLT